MGTKNERLDALEQSVDRQFHSARYSINALTDRLSALERQVVALRRQVVVDLDTSRVYREDAREKLTGYAQRQDELSLRVGRVESAVGGMRMSDVLARVERFENTVLNTIDRNQLDPTLYPAPAAPERWRPEVGKPFWFISIVNGEVYEGIAVEEMEVDDFVANDNCFPTREAAEAERARREKENSDGEDSFYPPERTCDRCGLVLRFNPATICPQCERGRMTAPPPPVEAPEDEELTVFNSLYDAAKRKGSSDQEATDAATSISQAIMDGRKERQPSDDAEKRAWRVRVLDRVVPYAIQSTTRDSTALIPSPIEGDAPSKYILWNGDIKHPAVPTVLGLLVLALPTGYRITRHITTGDYTIAAGAIYDRPWFPHPLDALLHFFAQRDGIEG